MAIPKVKITFDADLDGLRKGTKNAEDEIQGFGGKIADFGKKAAAAFAVVAAAAGAMAIKIGKEAISAASDLAETVSKVGVLFGDSAKQIEAFAAKAATNLGQSKQQALNAAATFATFGRAAGLAGDDLATFSTDFVTLASDLASFNNTSPEQAINAIGSALRGEAEPLRAYGVLLDDASLRQAALKLGIVNTTKNALTPQQKVLAAQKLIFEQTGAAQGDFARTSDGLANSQRILAARIENVKTTLGEILLPIALKVTEFFSTKLLPIIENLANRFDSGTGESLLGSIKNAFAFIQDFFAPIWEVIIGAFGRVNKAITDNKDRFASIINTFSEIVSWVNNNLVPLFQVQIVQAIEIGSRAISLAIKAIVPIIEFVVNAVKNLVNGVIDGINLLIRGYNAFARLTGRGEIPLLNKIGEITATNTNLGSRPLGALAGAAGTATGITSAAVAGQTAAAAVAAGAGAGTGKSLLGTGVKSAEDLVNKLTDVSESLTEIEFLYATGQISRAQASKELAAIEKEFAKLEKVANALSSPSAGIDVLTNSRALARAEAAQYNITVNGALDAESVSRQIVTILNESQARGTVGAGALRLSGGL